MKDEAETTAPSAATLHAALLDYYSAPGKYQLTLRQPATLFASIREILQLAAGRGDDAGGTLREAANFFIRAALLYPGADHYAVMGFAPGSEPSDLKERYRLLMRLIHPDFAQAGAAAWPSDAAVRVNRAYEVLSSPVQRRDYEEQLAALRQQRPAPAAKGTSHVPAALARRAQPPRLQVGKRAAWALGVTLAGIAVLMLMPRQEPEHLVQRKAAALSLPAPELPAAPAPLELPASHAMASDPGVPLVPSGAPALAPQREALPPPAQVARPAHAPIQGPVQAPAHAPPQAPVHVARPEPAPAPMPLPAPPARLAAPAVLVVPPKPTVAIAMPRPQEPARAASQPAAIAQAPAAPVPPPLPAPVVSAAAVVPAPAAPPTAIPAASGTPVAKATTTTVALPAIASPTLSDAQPLLTQVLQMLETGSGDQLLRLLEADARHTAGAQALSRNYEQLVKGARPVRLTQVEFKGEPRDGVLLVTGRIRLHAGDTTIGSHGERFLLRAEFASRGGKVMLTNLSGAPD